VSRLATCPPIGFYYFDSFGEIGALNSLHSTGEKGLKRASLRALRTQHRFARRFLADRQQSLHCTEGLYQRVNLLLGVVKAGRNAQRLRRRNIADIDVVLIAQLLHDLFHIAPL
jgi:hypothetical protein